MEFCSICSKGIVDVANESMCPRCWGEKMDKLPFSGLRNRFATYLVWYENWEGSVEQKTEEQHFLCSVCQKLVPMENIVVCCGGHGGCSECWVKENQKNQHSTWTCYMVDGCQEALNLTNFKQLPLEEQKLMNEGLVSKNIVKCPCGLYFESTGKKGLIFCPNCKNAFCGGCCKFAHFGELCIV